MVQNNRLLLQTFEWHTPSTPGASHYARLLRLLPQLSVLGFTAIWLPPGCKANNPEGNGYDVYDPWDLGEFDQKGARNTKWGSREELNGLILKAKELDIEVVWDAVLSHKQAGDRTEMDVWAVEVDPEDRRYEICPPKKIEAWLQYEFPGREAQGMKYSNFKWRAEHFNGTDWDQSREKNAIHKLIDDPAQHPEFQQPKKPAAVKQTPPRSRLAQLRRRFGGESKKEVQPKQPPPRRPGKGWAEDVDTDHGNNDYLMFSNIDYSHPDVREEVANWGKWMVKDVGIQGFRLDAVQHISYSFMREWIQQIRAAYRERTGRDVFVVGEVWTGEADRILKWLDAVQRPSGPQVYAYDSSLLYNFSRISEDVRQGSKNTDLRTILRGSLLYHRPKAAVTVVTNHDTQPGQTCYTPIHSELKSLFYAFILLRQEGYPCVFWGDLFGTKGPQSEAPACLVPDAAVKGGKRSLLPALFLCRKFVAGKQVDYWDNHLCIGWTRAGTEDNTGFATVMNVAQKGTEKSMKVGMPGDTYMDVLGQVDGTIKIDADGYGAFPCKGRSVSVFARADSGIATQLPVEFDLDV